MTKNLKLQKIFAIISVVCLAFPFINSVIGVFSEIHMHNNYQDIDDDFYSKFYAEHYSQILLEYFFQIAFCVCSLLFALVLLMFIIKQQKHYDPTAAPPSAILALAGGAVLILVLLYVSDVLHYKEIGTDVLLGLLNCFPQICILLSAVGFRKRKFKIVKISVLFVHISMILILVLVLVLLGFNYAYYGISRIIMAFLYDLVYYGGYAALALTIFFCAKGPDVYDKSVKAANIQAAVDNSFEAQFLKNMNQDK